MNLEVVTRRRAKCLPAVVWRLPAHIDSARVYRKLLLRMQMRLVVYKNAEAAANAVK